MQILVRLSDRTFGMNSAKFLFCFVAMFLCMAGHHSLAAPLPASDYVSYVLDGDTIVLNSGEKVRYIGIDAPEVSHESSPGDCYGEEATKYNKELVLHRKVFLTYDAEKRDPHGRLLAYVSLPDGRCINTEMIRAGCAFVFRSKTGFGRLKEFLSLQHEAIEKQVGLWGACVVTKSPSYIGNRGTFVFHRFDCHYGRRISLVQQVRFSNRLSAFEEGFRPCRFCKP